jgi:hypothetical protein
VQVNERAGPLDGGQYLHELRHGGAEARTDRHPQEKRGVAALGRHRLGIFNLEGDELRHPVFEQDLCEILNQRQLRQQPRHHIGWRQFLREPQLLGDVHGSRGGQPLQRPLDFVKLLLKIELRIGAGRFRHRGGRHGFQPSRIVLLHRSLTRGQVGHDLFVRRDLAAQHKLLEGATLLSNVALNRLEVESPADQTGSRSPSHHGSDQRS